MIQLTPRQAKALLEAIEGYAQDQGVTLEAFLEDDPELAGAMEVLRAES